jgi:hypothetical protein
MIWWLEDVLPLGHLALTVLREIGIDSNATCEVVASSWRSRFGYSATSCQVVTDSKAFSG